MIGLLIPISVFTGVVYATLHDWYLLFSFGFLAPILLLIPRLLYRLKFIRQKFTVNWKRFLENSGAGLFLLTAPGTIYFFEAGIEYDSFVHFAAFFTLTLVIAVFYASHRYLKGRSTSAWRAALISFIVGVILGPLWELFQKGNDLVFGTHMFFDPVQHIAVDVAYDLLFDVLGTILATLVIYLWWAAIFRPLVKKYDAKTE